MLLKVLAVGSAAVSGLTVIGSSTLLHGTAQLAVNVSAAALGAALVTLAHSKVTP